MNRSPGSGASWDGPWPETNREDTQSNTSRSHGLAILMVINGDKPLNYVGTMFEELQDTSIDVGPWQ